MHYISNRKLSCFSCIIAIVHQNSPTVEFWWEKIEGNLRRANTEPSLDFRRANIELSQDFSKANMEPSVHFRRANTKTYWQYNFLQALPSGNPSEQPYQPSENPSFPPLLVRLTKYVGRDIIQQKVLVMTLVLAQWPCGTAKVLFHHSRCPAVFQVCFHVFVYFLVLLFIQTPNKLLQWVCKLIVMALNNTAGLTTSLFKSAHDG